MMSNKKYFLLFVLIMLMAMVAALSAAEQTKCPVTGEKIDKELFVEQDGKRIYVCSEDCIDEVKENFSAYEKKLSKCNHSEGTKMNRKHKQDCTGSDCESKPQKTQSGCCSKKSNKI
jgi:hypothetical protein